MYWSIKLFFVKVFFLFLQKSSIFVEISGEIRLPRNRFKTDWPRPSSVKNHFHNIQLFDLKCPGDFLDLENISGTFSLDHFHYAFLQILGITIPESFRKLLLKSLGNREPVNPSPTPDRQTFENFFLTGSLAVTSEPLNFGQSSS